MGGYGGLGMVAAIMSEESIVQLIRKSSSRNRHDKLPRQLTCGGISARSRGRIVGVRLLLLIVW